MAGIIEELKKPLDQDINFVVDGVEIVMSLCETCSTTKWVFKPKKQGIDSNNAFQKAMIGIFARLTFIDFFANAVFEHSREQASVIFAGESAVYDEIIVKPKYWNNMGATFYGLKTASIIARTIDYIAECLDNNVADSFKTSAGKEISFEPPATDQIAPA